jgi:hypothetical protein
MTESLKKLRTFWTNNKKHFAVCTDKGFRIHDAVIPALKVNCEQIEHGLTLCQSYLTTSLFFVVGTRESVEFPSNKLILWDNDKK